MFSRLSSRSVLARRAATSTIMTVPYSFLLTGYSTPVYFRQRNNDRTVQLSMSSRSPWALLACAASLALAACVPDLGLMPTEKPPSAYATEKTLAAPKADWPAADWWTAYGDAQLDGLIAEGIASAPDLKIAEARLRQAD